MAKAEKKGRGKRQPRPKSDAIANLLRPHRADGIKAIAELLVKGEKVGIGAINSCLMSAAEVTAQIAAYNKASEDWQQACVAAEEAGKDEPDLVLPSTSPLYDPVIAEAVRALNCRVAIEGQKAKVKAQSDWPEGQLGKWQEGRKIEEAVRVNHIRDLRKYVVDPANNVLKVGSSEYLVGNDDNNAILLASSSKTGSYAANQLAAKRLSLGEAKIGNLVARFNNGVVELNLDDGTKPGGLVHFLPNQLAEWGYLKRDGRTMTYAQIRKAVTDGETTGIKFEPSEPIVGESFAQGKFFQSVQRIMSLVGTKDEEGKTSWDRYSVRAGKLPVADNAKNVWHNLQVQARVNPERWFCFGFENLQWGIVPIMHYGDKVDEQQFHLVVNVRVGTEYRESRTDARARIQPEPVKREKKVVAEKPARKKAEKKVAEPKVAKPKVEKPKVAKPKVEKKVRKTKAEKTAATAQIAAPEVVQSEPQSELQSETASVSEPQGTEAAVITDAPTIE